MNIEKLKSEKFSGVKHIIVLGDNGDEVFITDIGLDTIWWNEKTNSWYINWYESFFMGDISYSSEIVRCEKIQCKLNKKE